MQFVESFFGEGETKRQKARACWRRSRASRRRIKTIVGDSCNMVRTSPRLAADVDMNEENEQRHLEGRHNESTAVLAGDSGDFEPGDRRWAVADSGEADGHALVMVASGTTLVGSDSPSGIGGVVVQGAVQRRV